MTSERNYEPNGSAANKDDVAQKNREARAQATHARPPVDGSDRPEKTQSEKVALKAKPSFDWQSIGSWDTNPTADKIKALKVTKVIEDYVIDHFYGDWYWNTIIPVGVCFFAYAFAWLGFSVLWLLVVLLCASSVYRAEYRRFNRDVRDDMLRINSSNRLEDELETMEWLNSFMAKFWVIYMPALSEMVLFQANEVMKDQAPGFGIEAISLDEFTLGSKAPRVDSIKSYTRKGKDHIEMDWAFSFTPNDTDDMTKNELKKKINPKVALGVTVGKAFISKSLPILVEDMSFTGRMNIKLKLTESFPHVKTVSVQFLEPPIIDYALKPVGGDTLGIDIMSFIPGLASFVNGLIHSNLRPMLYAPNSLDIDVEEIMAQQSNDSIGVIACTVKRIINLKSATELKDNVFNPYVEMKISNNAAISERTNAKKNTKNPVYLETKYLLVNALENNHLTFNVFHLVPDQMEDTPLGVVQVPLVDLLQEEVQLGVKKNIIESGKVVGQLEFDLRWHESLKADILEDGTKEEHIDTETGIMKLSVFGAADLDVSKSVIGLLSPYAEVYVNGELIKVSRKLKKTNEPSFGVTFESLVTQQSSTQIQVLVKDSAEDVIVGRLDANLQDLVFESSRGQQWITAPPITENGIPTKFCIGAKWKALAFDDEELNIQTNAPIGGLRLHLRHCEGLVNLESVGDVDPYVRVVQNGKLKSKTPIIANTSNPYYNQVFFLSVTNEHQHVLLDILDAEPEGKDRPLGSCAIAVKDFLKKNSAGYFLGYDGSEEVIEQPVLYNGKSYGSMFYSVSFIPTLPVYTRTQLENLEELERLKKERAQEEQKRLEADEKKFKENPDMYEWIDMEDDVIPDAEKIEIPLEKAIKYRSGNIIVQLVGGQFNKPDYYVHVLFDDHAYPSNVTPKCESRELSAHTKAEAFIRDLPNSKLVLRIAKKREVEDDNEIVAEKIFPTLEVLEKSYHKPLKLKVNNKNWVDVQLEFIPSAAKLAPLDTVLDVGYLKLDILGAEHLLPADKNGKSDPLCVVKLNGVEVHKTDKKRRTLDPLWNDAIEFPMLSRSKQTLILEVYDWDLTHDDRLLGRANVDLSTLTPNSSTHFKLDLDTQGALNLRATFKPEYVRPALSKTNGLPINFGDITGAPLKVVGGAAGLAGDAVGGGVGLVSDGVAKGTSFLKGLGKHKKSEEKESEEAEKEAKAKKAGKDKDAGEEDQDSDAVSATSSEKARQEEEEENEEEDNRQGAPAPEEQMEHSEAPELKNSVPNVVPDLLPPPQKPNGANGHRRSASTSTEVSSIKSGAIGGAGIPGRVNIMSASGFSGHALDVKTSLVVAGKNKDIHKTRTAKTKDGSCSWNESAVFKAPTEGLLSLSVRERKTFGKSTTVGSAEIALADYVDSDATHTVQVGEGSVTFHLRYVTTQL